MPGRRRSVMPVRLHRRGHQLLALGAAIDGFAPRLYLCFALPAILFLALTVPPFQVADEIQHFLRADQISHGELVGYRLGESESGGRVDPAIVAAVGAYGSIPFHPDAKLSRKMSEAGRAIAWTGRTSPVSFPYMVNYGPLLYLPQVVGIWIGKLARLPVVDTLVLARLVNGACAAALGFLALGLCRHGRAAMFMVLLLPMTLFQFASVSQDALFISSSLLALGLVSHVIAGGRTASRGELALFVAILGAVTMARPPAAVLACLLPLMLGPEAGEAAGSRPAWPRRRWIAGFVLLVVIAWFATNALHTFVAPAPKPGISPVDQILYLAQDPVRFLGVFRDTLSALGEPQYKSAIGLLGWLDTFLPDYYYRLAGAALLLACATDLAGAAPLPSRAGALALAVVVLFVGGIFTAQYLDWTPVGSPIVEGVMGRYFLGFLPLVAWLPLRLRGSWRPAPMRLAWLAVAAFPIVTLAQLPVTIIERYYLVP
jgi:uncharacterized membrane protein